MVTSSFLLTLLPSSPLLLSSFSQEQDRREKTEPLFLSYPQVKFLAAPESP